MKRFYLLFVTFVMAVSMVAQVYPTKFLGIPIDGTKQEMIKKIEAKGFTYDREHDCLNGQFNGTDVFIYVKTNKDKVCQIMVMDKTGYSESYIKIAYNNLLKQFENNPKYLVADLSQKSIPDKENISYEMTVNNKLYRSYFLQITHELDTTMWIKDMERIAKEAAEQIATKYDVLGEHEQDLMGYYVEHKAANQQYLKNIVWFQISKYADKYYLAIYYENMSNHANGEDL